jgi:hypothetical protein
MCKELLRLLGIRPKRERSAQSLLPHRALQPGEMTASELLQKELDKPKSIRNMGKIHDLNDVITTTNIAQFTLEKKGSQTGVKANALKVEPIVDEDAQIKGFKVK